MRTHFTFLALLFGVVGLFAYLTWTFSERDLFLFHGRHAELGLFLNSYRDSHTPIRTIDFSELYGRSGQFQVLHPLLSVHSAGLGESLPACGGTETVPNAKQPGSCRPSEDMRPSDSIAAAEWEKLNESHRNKHRALDTFINEKIPLSESFLTTPPFVDRQGESYAYKLVSLGIPPYSQKEWVKNHLTLFQVSELSRVLTKFEIGDAIFATIARLTEAELEDVVRGAPVILTSEYLLLKNQSSLGFSPLSYWFFDRKNLQAELQNGDYELVPALADAVCLERVGHVCWTYNSKHALSYLYRYSLVVLILIAAMFAVFLALYIRHLLAKSREEQRRRLSLQVLSHEFRTPVTSMMLMLEQLNNKLQKFDVKDQDLITRVSSEAFRLQRIIEVSRTYLQADTRRIPFRWVEIESVNDWIRDFVGEFDHKIECELLASDQSIQADPFWLKFALSNLVHNAFAHGKAPVRLRLSQQPQRLQITIEDQGKCEFETLNEMTEAFVKSRRSQGMGLGLNITRAIVKEWGSDIQFSKFPTAFTLSLHRGGEYGSHIGG